MSTDEVLKIAKSPADLDRLLGRIEGGELSKPDWIRLQGQCRLDAMSEDERQGFLSRMHGAVLRGFKNTCEKPRGR